MIKHFLAAAIRFWTKNIAIISLNVVAYGIGMTACILILQNIFYETSFDRFHKNYENIYRVSLDHYYPHNLYQNSTAITFYPMAGELKNQYSEIKEFTRMSGKSVNTDITYQKKILREDNVYAVDSMFFKIFSVTLLKGTLINLKPEDIFLSETFAKKLFESEEPIGKLIQFWGGTYEVKGVYQDVPTSSHMHYDVLMVVRTFEESLLDWQHYSVYTYMLLNDGVDPKLLQEKLRPFSVNYSKLSDEQSDVDYRWEIKLQALKDIYLKSDIEFEHELNGSAENVTIFKMIAFLIIAITCFNFSNLNNSLYSKRFSEFFTRKVYGASRAGLLTQYSFESLLLTLFGCGIGVLILVMISQTSFNRASFSWSNPALIFGGVIIASICFVFSGLVPAVAFSFFSPLKFLKGAYTNDALKKRLAKSLVVIQFIISFVLITGAMVVNKQLSYVSDNNPGVDVTDVVVVDFPGQGFSDSQGALTKFKTDLEGLSEVKSVSFSESVPGTKYVFDASLRFADETSENAKFCYLQLTSSNYFDTYGIKLLAGRVYDEHQPSDLQSVILNETIAKKLNITDYSNVIDKTVVIPWAGAYQSYRVIGVVTDYFHQSLKTEIKPCVFLPIWKDGACNKISIKLNDMDANTYGTVIKTTEKLFKGIFPFVYSSVLAEDNYKSQYLSDYDFSFLVNVFAGLAVMMSAVGLFGMAANETAKRGKEVAIRKINGATSNDIYFHLLKEHLILIAISFFFSVPVSYFLVTDWLSHFSARIDLNFSFMILPLVLILIISSLAISYYLIKASLLNPISVLRSK